jgi:uncharacterized protein YxjI
MIEPSQATRTTTQFVLRSDFPNVFITDGDGRDLYWVRSGVAQGLGLWSLQDLGGHELVSARQEETWPLPSYGLYRAEERVATVREAPGTALARWRGAIRVLIRGTPARLRYTVRTPGAGTLEVSGDPGAVEYHLTRDGRRAASVALRWLAWAPTFGLSVHVDEGEDPLLILTITAMIESAWGRL